MITVAELDRAAAAGKVELTRGNARPVRCATQGDRRLIPEGQGRRVWIDGHARGFLCGACQWAVLTTVRKGYR
jgi:hypothetical protein